MITFSAELPPTINQTYKISGGRMYKTQKAVSWQTIVGWSLKGKKPLKGKIFVEIDMFLKYDRDIDSSLKLLFDEMQAVGLLKNDKQIHRVYVEKFIDKTNPRLEVRIGDI